MNRPNYATCSKTAEARTAAAKPSTFPTLLRVQQAEICPATKNEHHVHGKMFCYSTLSLDQDVLSRYDQQNPLYPYKATSDPDTLYLHQAMKSKDWPQFRKTIQK